MDKQEELRYPIGKFEYGKTYSIGDTKRNIRIIAALPKDLKKIIKKISKHQLDKPYRSGGWTVRQVVHHLGDSHINAYIRMKMAVTEKNPVIKPYDERAWAELESGRDASIKVSLNLLKALHKKWVGFMEALSEKDLKKGYFHPASNRTVLLPEAIALYAWHVEHHLAHIRLVIGTKHDRTELTAKIKPMPSTEAPTEKTEDIPATTTPKRGRPAAAKSAPVEKVTAPKLKPTKVKAASEGPKMTRAEVLAKARAARAAKVPAKVKPESEAPKMTRAEVLAKARAARAAKAPAKEKVENQGPKLTKAEALAKARAARAANAPAKEKVENQGPKLTKAEALAKARAARAAKAPATPKVVSEGPKLTKVEALAKARAEKKAKKAASTEAPTTPVETKAPAKRTSKKKVSE